MTRKIQQENVNTAIKHKSFIKEIGTQSGGYHMEVLKKPIVISQTTVEALARMKGTTTYKKRWAVFGTKEIKSITYKITEFKFHVWNVKRQAWTHLSEDGLYEVLHDYDFPNMRKNYFTMIKAPLEFLGATFRKNKITND
jgi:hypothetical protein